jgi:hypothetical protein
MVIETTTTFIANLRGEKERREKREERREKREERREKRG